GAGLGTCGDYDRICAGASLDLLWIHVSGDVLRQSRDAEVHGVCESRDGNDRTSQRNRGTAGDRWVVWSHRPGKVSGSVDIQDERSFVYQPAAAAGNDRKEPAGGSPVGCGNG